MKELKTIGRDELLNLTATRETPCVSIYIPTAKAGKEAFQGGLHLKNLLKEAEKSLPNGDKAGILNGAARLVDDMPFWQYQDAGLALFLTAGESYSFKSPIPVPARQVVCNAFDITPLLPALMHNGKFYVLTLSQDKIRVIEASRYDYSEIQIDDMPQSIDEALTASGAEKQQQRHGGASGPPTYFGSGGGQGSEDQKDDLKRFFDRVDVVFSDYLAQHPAPVILAGVEYLLPIYRTANTGATILTEEIRGNCDRTPAQELQESGWRIASKHFAESAEKAKSQFEQSNGHGNASTSQKEIAAAADAGRIASLFVAFDHPEAASLNQLIHATLATGGEIIPLSQSEMPSNKPLAATFRY
ncbi:hypothetical protein QPK87_19010 [Kamptonema cortianum]|nr:hypothetical protein [Geitlerinema splendidum]MDK3158646.1 hypothetical protein [Kamptonema cortianum]